METYKYYTALIIAMAMSTCMVFAQAPVKRNPSNNASTSHTHVATPPKQTVTNKPAPLNGYHEKTYSDGRVYKGNFKNDLFDGYGELKLADGTVYKGEFKNGKSDGNGELKRANGTVYKGEFKNGKCEGDAEVKLADGAVYKGGFRDGQYDGYGEFKFENFIYNGYFQNGNFHGTGTLVWPDGSKYVGDFIDNKRTGQGVYTTIDGYRYEGQFVDGLYQGKGVETWKQDATKPNNSCRVECMYEKGKRHGSGTAYYNDYTYKKGIWENGTMVKVTENGTWHW